MTHNTSPLQSYPLAPIAFFCYNRPDKVRIALEALRANILASESKLFVFSDGPKDDKSADGVRKLREYLYSVDGFASVEVIERERNYGCAGNIINGITQVVNEFGRIIIMEDDVLACPFFLRYVNEGLEIYKDDENVSSIGGFLRRYKNAGQLPQSFFMYDGIWGWGTWQRAWKDYEYDAAKLLAKINSMGIENEFNMNFEPKFHIWTEMLKAVAEGRLDTWDVQWRAVNFIHGRLSLSPCMTLTKNIGIDGSGTHGVVNKVDRLNGKFPETFESLKRVPVEFNQYAYDLERKAVLRLLHPSLLYRILSKIYRTITGKNRRKPKP